MNRLLIRDHLGSYLVQIDTHYVQMGITSSFEHVTVFTVEIVLELSICI
jgi:hypothetical protein